MRSVIIYGDSLMKGTVIDARQRYHATMQEKLDALHERYALEFCNRARFGSTVEKGKHILEKDLSSAIRSDYVLIEFGGNDCDFHWNEISAAPEQPHQPKTPLAQFRATLLDMVEAARRAGMIPVLMTLPPIDSQRYLEFISQRNDKRRILQWLGDAHMIYRFHELYSGTIGELARQTGTLLVDVRARFLEQFRYQRLIGADGIHLAPEGYGLLEDTFCTFIEKVRAA